MIHFFEALFVMMSNSVAQLFPSTTELLLLLIGLLWTFSFFGQFELHAIHQYTLVDLSKHDYSFVRFAIQDI